jgi:hypothetical protein
MCSSTSEPIPPPSPPPTRQVTVQLRGLDGSAAIVHVCAARHRGDSATEPTPCLPGWLSAWSHPIPPGAPLTAPLIVSRPLHGAPAADEAHNAAAWRGAVVVLQRGRLPLCELASRVAQAGGVAAVVLDRRDGVCRAAGFTQSCVPGGVGGAAAGVGWAGGDPPALWQPTAGMPAVLLAETALPAGWE